jgi:hypothetical protein
VCGGQPARAVGDALGERGAQRLRRERGALGGEGRVRVGDGERPAPDGVQEALQPLVDLVVEGAVDRAVHRAEELLVVRVARAQPELQAPLGDEVGGGGLLGEAHRVLVPDRHHGRAELEAAGPLGDRGEERERRGQVRLEVARPHPPGVVAQLLGVLEEPEARPEPVGPCPVDAGVLDEREEADPRSRPVRRGHGVPSPSGGGNHIRGRPPAQ